jgi:hypothetical protein
LQEIADRLDRISIRLVKCLNRQIFLVKLTKLHGQTQEETFSFREESMDLFRGYRVTLFVHISKISTTTDLDGAEHGPCYDSGGTIQAMPIFSGYITGENSLEQLLFHVMTNGISRKELEIEFQTE